MNTFIVSGHIGNVETQTTKNGNQMLKFSLGENRYRKDANGNGVNETVWIKCTVFSPTAYQVNSLVKGKHVTVVGDLDLSTYTNKDGQKVVRQEVVVQQLHFAGPGKEEKPDTSVSGGVASSASAANDDDLPF